MQWPQMEGREGGRKGGIGASLVATAVEACSARGGMRTGQTARIVACERTGAAAGATVNGETRVGKRKRWNG